VITGILMVAFFVAFAVASMHEGLAGLWERISLGFGMVRKIGCGSSADLTKPGARARRKGKTYFYSTNRGPRMKCLIDCVQRLEKLDERDEADKQA
jgi:hypothetical protein